MMASKTHLIAAFAGLAVVAAAGGLIAGRMLSGDAAPARPQGNPYGPASQIQAQNPLQPITHAQAAGILTCAGAVVATTRAIVDAPHRASSAWVSAAPDDHAFTSIVSLSYAARNAPRAVAVMTATPTPQRGCDTNTVQVHPTARSCAQVEADLAREGRVKAEINGLSSMKSPDGKTHVLLPTANGDGCVIVAVANAAGR